MRGTIPFDNRRYVGNQIGLVISPDFVAPASDKSYLSVDAPSLHELLLMGFLCVMLIVYSGAWIYPPALGFGGVESLQLSKPGGVPFNYMAWLGIIFAVGYELSRFSVARIGVALKPMVPFATVGFFAALVGYDPAASLRLYFLWMAMMLVASTIGAGLSARYAANALLKSFLLIIALSVFLSVAFPDFGTQMDRTDRVWRGAFVAKGILGWFSSIGMVVAVGMYEKTQRKLALALLIGSTLCVIGSGSKGAIVVTLSGVAYRLFLPMVVGRVSAGLAFVILLLIFVFSALASQVLMPFVLEALGRDPSLTGRTDIWAMYFESMIRSPWIGSGPGAYTGLSPFTAVLAARLASFGGILTPHNMYLGALGDTGAIGLFIFVLTFGYFVFVAPLIYSSRVGFTSASIGFLMMIGGFVETHEIFNVGVSGYCLVLTYSMAVSQANRERTGRVTDVSGSGTAFA